MEVSSKNVPPKQIFHVLVQRIKEANSVASLTKLFSIIFGILRRSSYDSQYLQELQGVQELNYPTISDKKQHQWVKELTICCITYLGRVASIADIYHRTMSYKMTIIGEKTMMSDLFRLLNVYSLLFPLLGHVTSTVGRYCRDEYPCFSDFYRTMRA